MHSFVLQQQGRGTVVDEDEHACILYVLYVKITLTLTLRANPNPNPNRGRGGWVGGWVVAVGIEEQNSTHTYCMECHGII